MDAFWEHCLGFFERRLPPAQFTTWIKPLRLVPRGDGYQLIGPSAGLVQYVRERFLASVEAMATDYFARPVAISLVVEDRPEPAETSEEAAATPPRAMNGARNGEEANRLNGTYTFASFVNGRANEMARAASHQVAEHPGTAYNPLFIYGASGLGKTHLVHAIGNHVMQTKHHARLRYLHASEYMDDVVKAYQNKSWDSFKRYYHSLDLLLIDDIQFFAGRDRTQEEFFLAFNALIEARRQVIITCDRFPKEIGKIEDRLKSRFNWGLTVQVEPPELELREAILLNKARLANVVLGEDVAGFIAHLVQSNVRELEGALNRVIAHARFSGEPLCVPMARQALRDLLAVQTRQLSIENIQKTVADYFKVKVSDMFSDKRARSVARPRQIAMSLARALTDKSFPEIGEAFGGRDHSTVIHAVRSVKQLVEEDADIARDWERLQQMLRG